jgi:hypothetical protein
VSAYQLWAAEDGSWGGGEVVVIDTTLMTDEQIQVAAQRLDEASDGERLEVARQIRDERS